MSSKKGFTMIELLVVVGIIAVMSAIVLALLSDARSKGADGATKSNLTNGRSQGEVFYNTNTAAVNSYTSFCNQVAVVGGAKTFFAGMQAAAKSSTGSTTYTTNGTGAVGSATCNENGLSWAAEAPLKGAGANQMWCVDSVGKSKQENNVSIGATFVCP